MAALDAGQVWHHPSEMQVGNLKHDTYTLPKDPWAAVFGEARGRDTGSAYDVRSTTTWTMPQAYQGQRDMIGQQIERMIFHEGNWHMRVVMPFQRHEEAEEVVWNQIVFDPHLASPTPELGVVRLVQSKRIQNTASWIRFGIGYYMEHGFMNTRMGIEYHIEHLRQLAQSALEATKFDVVFTLFQYQTINREWELKFGRFKRQKVEDVVSERVWMFACLQKYKRALKMLDIHVNEIMAQYGGKADTWIVPPPIINYFSVAKEEYLSFSIAGPRGPDIAFDNPKPLFPLNNSQVFVSRTYHTSELTGHEEILSKRSEIGEYYLFEDRFTDDHTNYRTKWRHIRIYNEDANQWWEVTPKWVLDNSHLFHAPGSVKAGEPLYADELGPNSYAHHVDGDEGKRDIWEYYERSGSSDGTGEMIKAKLFGEMQTMYFTTRDKLQWADTAIAALRRDYSDTVVTGVMNDWARGMELIDEIEQIPYAPTDAENWTAIFGAAPEAEVRGMIGAKLHTVFDTPEAQGNVTTGFTKHDSRAKKIDQLIPGIQSYAGLKLLGEIGDPDKMGRQMEAARQFIKAVDLVVDNLKKYAPNSVLLQKSYANAWWPHAKDATTFFENAVVGNRVPLFVSTAGGNVYQRQGDDEEGRWKSHIEAIYDTIKNHSVWPGSPLIPAQVPYPHGGVSDAQLRRDAFKYLLAVVLVRLLNAAPDATDEAKLEEVFGAGLTLPQEARSESEMIASVVNRIREVDAGRKKPLFEQSGKKELTATFKNLAEKFNTAWKNYQDPTNKAGSYEARKDYVRTTILASPAYLASLASAQAAGLEITMVPADPDFPEIIMTAARLDEGTRYSPDRHDIKAKAVVAPEQELEYRLNPAFLALDQTSKTVRSLAFVNHAISFQLGHTIESDEIVADENDINEPMPRIGAQIVESALQSIGAGPFENVDVSTRSSITPHDRAVNELLAGMLSTPYRNGYMEINQLSSSPLQQAIAHVFCATPIHRKAFDAFIQNHLVIPLSAVLCRPHMTYSMLCMIKCLAGLEMGMTLIKDGRFEVQDDAATHAHLGTYIYYSKAVVKDSRHVYVAQEVFANGYLGGTGIRAINPAVYQAGEGEPDGSSIVVIAKPYNNPITGLFSLTGRLTLSEFEDYELAEDGHLLYDTCRRYNGLFGWNQARLVDDFDKGPMDGTAEHIYNNVLCHQGHTYAFYLLLFHYLPY